MKDFIARILFSDQSESSQLWLFFVMAAGLALLCACVGFLLRKIMTPVIRHLTGRTMVMWDDYLLNRNVLNAAWSVVCGTLFYWFLPYCHTLPSTHWYIGFEQGAKIYITLAATHTVTAFLRNICKYTTQQEEKQKHGLIGIMQFLRLLTYCICGVIVISFLFGRNPISIIAGLGAAATVLMLVFKDTILGLVAGIQLSANNMLKPGDWVTIQKLGINGTVEQVSLTTVKIRNFDNTISTVPPYTLVSDSFQNWANMYEEGARRVKRAFYLDVNTIRFLEPEEEEHLRKEFALQPNADDITLGARPVNLTLFRQYVTHHLQQLAYVRQQDWVLVRQLEPTPHGLPVELWFYLSETEFVRFENQASCVMEHFMAILPAFGLRLYQAWGEPS